VTANIETAWAQMVQDQLNSLKVPPHMTGEMMGARIRDEWSHTSHDRKHYERAVFGDMLRQYVSQYGTGHRKRPVKFWLAMLVLTVFIGTITVPIPLIFPVGMATWTIYASLRWYALAHRPEPESPPQRHSATFRTFPRSDARPGKERIGDVERDQVLAELTIHFSAGRMKQDEYETRMSHVLDSVTAEDLSNALCELPMLNHEELRRIP